MRTLGSVAFALALGALGGILLAAAVLNVTAFELIKAVLQ